MANLTTFVMIVVATAFLMIGSSEFNEQVVNAQNKTENNNTDDESINESGSISSFPKPIRPPFA
jgi:hypothetical protein